MILRYLLLVIVICTFVWTARGERLGHFRVRRANHHTLLRHQLQHGILQELSSRTDPEPVTVTTPTTTTTTPATTTTTTVTQPVVTAPSSNGGGGAGSTNAQQPMVYVAPASNGFLGLSERQFTILIVCGCVAAIVFVMLFFFRDKVRVIIGYIESGCYNFWKLILMPFVFLRWCFRRITYPLKQGCWACYETCYGYCHPATVKV